LPWEHALWNYGVTFRHMGVVMGLISTITLIVMLGVTGYYVTHNTLSMGDFVFTTALMLQFFPRFERLIARMRQVVKSYADLVSYFAILDYPLVMPDPKAPEKIIHARGEVAFMDVSFTYASGWRALDNVDFCINAGETVALVGRSGAGKTTITKLIMRMYDPISGRVCLDGHDIKNITKEDLRIMIGLVPQEPILFNNTIGYNIGYPLDNIGKEEVIAAAKLANLHEFIASLQHGYETTVGERGVKLSGGQKQRLAIARTFLLNPVIIIFDEATSHLDSESEALIQDSIAKLKKNKTLIIIAHRLSTVMKADRIIVLDHGRIAEIGTHKDLIQKSNGIYRRLWELQTEEVIDA
ncbi:MAG: ATP-binding cassette domain-containing protein, partial [Patescibacteria group bacterium]